MLQNCDFRLIFPGFAAGQGVKNSEGGVKSGFRGGRQRG